MLEPCDAKVSSTVLRGLGDRKVAWLLGSELMADHTLACVIRLSELSLFDDKVS